MARSFIAKITPSTIEKGDAKTGARFTTMKNCQVEKRGRGGKPETTTRTVMAFGRSNAAVANSLRPGKTVEVECQYDGGTIRILGRAPKKAA